MVKGGRKMKESPKKNKKERANNINRQRKTSLRQKDKNKKK